MESFDIHSDIQPSDTWLEEHHQVVESESGDKGTYHVFAMVTEPVFPLVVDGKALTGQKKISIDFPLGAVTIQLRGWYDTSSGDCEIKAYAKVPIIPGLLIGKFKGNLFKGIKITFGTKIISGFLRLYIKEGWLRVEFGVTVFGKTFSGDIKLIPVPIKGSTVEEAESGSKA